MDISQETLSQYLPTIEEFLTSVLLEETDVEVDSFKRVEKEKVAEFFDEADIYLYSRELSSSSDVIIVLGQEWFGLLSSIMLGIEEKEKNEQTIGLLKEFSDDLSDVIEKEAHNHEQEFDISNAQVFTKEKLIEELSHEEFYWTNLEIEGIADEKVETTFLLGDPETEIVEEREPKATDKDDEESEEEDSSRQISSIDEEESDGEFSTLEPNPEEKERKKQEVISARHIEFAEFTDENGDLNGDAHSMDLLKDVELDVSVELGRIELPLGKVLELAKGSVIELEKLAGEPVDVLVNGNRIALGEVVVIDEHFGVRISSLVTTKKRLAKLNGS